MPDRLGSTRLPLHTCSAGDVWYRLHRSEFDAKWFGPAPGDPPANRFDDPRGEYRICYLGTSVEASFAETMLRNPPKRLLSLSDLERRSITTFRLRRSVRLVRAHSDGLVKLGLTADAVHGSYDECGRIARALWENAAGSDGIEYRSRHDDEHLCIALFDRAADAIAAEHTEPLIADVPRMISLLRRYEVGLTS